MIDREERETGNGSQECCCGVIAPGERDEEKEVSEDKSIRK